ncbi:MAG: hypothetical protein ACRC32_03105 [Chroococcidiopsis sp.]
MRESGVGSRESGVGSREWREYWTRLCNYSIADQIIATYNTATITQQRRIINSVFCQNLSTL